MWIIVGEVIFYLIIGILLLGGLVLTIFALPGVWLIWLAILITTIVEGLEVMPLWFVILSFFLSVFITVIDNFVIAYGSKRFGGGKWGMVGAVVGAILGLLFGSLPGFFVGAFVGAFLAEHFMAKKNYDDAFKSGVGSSIGVVMAILLKFLVSLFMVIAFMYIFIF